MTSFDPKGKAPDRGGTWVCGINLHEHFNAIHNPFLIHLPLTTFDKLCLIQQHLEFAHLVKSSAEIHQSYTFDITYIPSNTPYPLPSRNYNQVQCESEAFSPSAQNKQSGMVSGFSLWLLYIWKKTKLPQSSVKGWATSSAVLYTRIPGRYSGDSCGE